MFHPCFVGICGDPGDVDLAGANLDKEQDVIFDPTSGGEHFLGEKVTSPQRFTVAAKELGPLAISRSWVYWKSVFAENPVNCRAASSVAEAIQLTLDPASTELILLGHAKDKFANFGRCLVVLRFFIFLDGSSSGLAFPLLFILNPTQKRPGCYQSVLCFSFRMEFLPGTGQVKSVFPR